MSDRTNNPCEVASCPNKATREDFVDSGRFKIGVCAQHYAERNRTNIDPLREKIVATTHAWIRDCGLDVRDVEAFVNRELMPVFQSELEEREKRAMALLAASLMNRFDLVAHLNNDPSAQGFTPMELAQALQEYIPSNFDAAAAQLSSKKGNE